MNFLQWFINGSTTAVILFFWQIVKWLYNQWPLVRKLRKTQELYHELYQEEVKHLTRLKSFISGIDKNGLQEAITYLQGTIPYGASYDAWRVVQECAVNLERARDRINDEATIEQKAHNKEVDRIMANIEAVV